MRRITDCYVSPFRNTVQLQWAGLKKGLVLSEANISGNTQTKTRSQFVIAEYTRLLWQLCAPMMIGMSHNVAFLPPPRVCVCKCSVCLCVCGVSQNLYFKMQDLKIVRTMQ